MEAVWLRHGVVVNEAGWWLLWLVYVVAGKKRRTSYDYLSRTNVNGFRGRSCLTSCSVKRQMRPVKNPFLGVWVQRADPKLGDLFPVGGSWNLWPPGSAGRAALCGLRIGRTISGCRTAARLSPLSRVSEFHLCDGCRTEYAIHRFS